MDYKKLNMNIKYIVDYSVVVKDLTYAVSVNSVRS